MIATRLTYTTTTPQRADCPHFHKAVLVFHDRTFNMYFTRHQDNRGKWCAGSNQKVKA